jgi:hypothetical protein
MKHLYFILIVLLSTLYNADGATITAVQNNGAWNSASTWDLGRIPKSNDTIIIPKYITVVITSWHILNGVQIKVYGTLNMQSGKLSLYSTSEVIVYKGGIISGNAAGEISIRGVQKFLGAHGAVPGSAIANASTGIAPNGFSPFSTMPVKFTGFFAKESGAYVQLAWATTDEINNSHFEIQRSNDGRTWSTIGKVAAGTAAINQYSYTDRSNKNGNTYYYRLKQVDKDGQFLFSTVKTIYANSSTEIATIYAASAQTIAVEFNEQLKGNILVRVVSINGQAIVEKVFTEPAYRMLLNIPSSTKGMYVVQVIGVGKIAESKKLIL